jgi:hypothetical protein
MSLTELKKRQDYINSQPSEEKEKLKARINDARFWDFVNKPQDYAKVR